MRRRSFAAPLVIVVACGAPQRAAAPEPAPVPASASADEEDADDADAEVARWSQPPRIVAVAARPDEVAPPLETPLPPPPPIVEARPPPPPRPVPPADVCRDPGEAWTVWRVTCNPPPTVNPPPSRQGKVVDLRVDGDAVIVTIGIGRDDGVDRGARAVLVDGKGRPVRGGDFVIVNVTSRTARGKVRLALDEVRQYDRVRVTTQP